ncbi:hypothetical protein VD0002_g2685 [Verticillium dahliae]|nr:hypothetical protein VD0004_g1767 [Verticillium dahliae]PNH56435.1 hypothetical protein VD0003_g1276 [Verticillium dahliae]PNH66780.1 hypothetical protein VD0002_g2685 [Verticillium dahliae]PNH75681.1 hypothetical protein VD0001_g1855 [Verticillium dahliae]
MLTASSSSSENYLTEVKIETTFSFDRSKTLSLPDYRPDPSRSTSSHQEHRV